MRNFYPFKVFVTIKLCTMHYNKHNYSVVMLRFLLSDRCKGCIQYLKIIPVIDILKGIAVHAVRGRREKYQPLESVLLGSADPVNVAVKLKELGFTDCYVADLDAITGGYPNFSLIKRLANKSDLELKVDAGVNSLAMAEKLLDYEVSAVVIGTETLSDIKFVAEAVAAFGSEKIIISLDLMGSHVLSKVELGSLADPVALLREFHNMGVSQFIVLDLTRVGSGEGVNTALLSKMLRDVKANFIVGGGVRDIGDLQKLKDLGVSGVLIATALHSGKISQVEIKQSGLIQNADNYS
jgi:phosphoribosylformimino-5-aminoimidazole carboxamide ribotide isomerase